jgi:hypothetical protein
MQAGNAAEIILEHTEPLNGDVRLEGFEVTR